MRKKQRAGCKAYLEIDLGGIEETEVEFTGTVELVDSGIGAYEWHGFKGNDVQWGWEILDYEWDSSKFSKEENELIEKWANANDEKIIDELLNNVEED